MMDVQRGNHQLVPMLLLKLAYQPIGPTRARCRDGDWNGAHDQAEAEDDRAEELTELFFLFFSLIFYTFL